jgi:DNA-binding transcriptional LysR family regulator
MYNLTFDQLYTVRTIAGTGSFHEASRILCLTQPAISQRVRHIERMLGAPVFDRHSGVGVSLTAVGELEAVRAPADEAALRVMAPSDIIQYLLVPMLPRFHERQPHLAMRVRQSQDRSEIVRMLSGGLTDLAFDRSPTHSSLQTVARMNEQLCLVAPPSHPILELPVRDRPAAIGRYPFATYSPGMRSRDLVQRWAAKAGAVIAPQIESRSIAVMKDAIAQEDAIGILPAISVSVELRNGSLETVGISDMPLVRATAIAARPGEERSPRVRAFVEELIGFCGQRLEGAAEVRWALPQADPPSR